MQGAVELSTAAAAELEAPLLESGFSLMESNPTRVSYRRDDVVIQFEIYPEDATPRPLNVALGLMSSDGSMRGIGAWELVPEGVTARQYSTWRFAGQSELRTTLRRVYREVVEKWLTVYFDDTGRLEDVVAASEQIRAAAHDADRVERLLRKARKAFEHGQYQAALDSYALAGVALGPADLKRRDIARHRLTRQ